MTEDPMEAVAKELGMLVCIAALLTLLSAPAWVTFLILWALGVH